MYKNVGIDVKISSLCELKRPELISIGDHVSIDSFVVCTTNLNLGNYIHISPHVSIIGGKNSSLTMNNFSFLSTGAKVVCASEEFYGEGLVCPFLEDKYRDNIINEPVIIEKFAGVCANSVILPGCVLSEGTIIGANSLVPKNTTTEPWTIYVGSPIKKLRMRRHDKIYKYEKEINQL